MTTLYPMIQQPELKSKIWGGRKLETVFGIDLPPGEPIGEAWLVADHPHGMSRVGNGPLAGRTLREIIDRHAEALYGSPAPPAWRERFPLLVKIIDARDDLSVQVHPDEPYIVEHGIDDYAKTECWIILEAEPGARLITDVAPGTSAEAFRRGADSGELEPMLQSQPVQPGDVMYIPAGRLHAIGAGIVLAEFQQPSDTTYRVYDWGRVDEKGNSRELHLEQAMGTIHFDGRFPGPGGLGVLDRQGSSVLESLVECPKFRVHRATARAGALQLRVDDSCQCAMIVEGEGRLAWADGSESLPLTRGQTVLVPAEAERYELRSPGRMVALLGSVPRPA